MIAKLEQLSKKVYAYISENEEVCVALGVITLLGLWIGQNSIRNLALWRIGNKLNKIVKKR